MYIQTQLTTLLQIFCTFMFNIEVILKSIVEPDDNFIMEGKRGVGNRLLGSVPIDFLNYFSDISFSDQSTLLKMFDGEMYIQTQLTTFLQIFCAFMFNIEVILKSIVEPDVNFIMEGMRGVGNRLLGSVPTDFLNYFSDISFLNQSTLLKMFDGEMYIQTQRTTPLQIFCTFMLNIEVILKSIVEPDVNFIMEGMRGVGNRLLTGECAYWLSEQCLPHSSSPSTARITRAKNFGTLHSMGVSEGMTMLLTKKRRDVKKTSLSKPITKNGATNLLNPFILSAVEEGLTILVASF